MDAGGISSHVTYPISIHAQVDGYCVITDQERAQNLQGNVFLYLLLGLNKIILMFPSILMTIFVKCLVQKIPLTVFGR